jgi:hypothetical protein
MFGDNNVHLRIPEIGWMSFCNLNLPPREKNTFLVNSKSHGNNFFPYAIGKKDPAKEFNENFIEIVDGSALKSLNTLLSQTHTLTHTHTHVCKYHSTSTQARNCAESFNALFGKGDSFGNLYKKKWLRRVGYEGLESLKITLIDEGVSYGFSIDNQLPSLDSVRKQHCVAGSDGMCPKHLGAKEDPNKMIVFIPLKASDPIREADLPFIVRKETPPERGAPEGVTTSLVRIVPRHIAFHKFDEGRLMFDVNPGLVETSHFRETYGKLLGVRSRITIHGIDNHVLSEFHKYFIEQPPEGEERTFPNVRVLSVSTTNRSESEGSSSEEEESSEDRSFEPRKTKCDRLRPGDHSGCSVCHYPECINVVGRELSEGYGLSREALVMLKRLFPHLECLHIDYAWLHDAASVPIIEIFGDAWHPTYFEESSDDDSADLGDLEEEEEEEALGDTSSESESEEEEEEFEELEVEIA